MKLDDLIITQEGSDFVLTGGGDDFVSAERGNDFVNGGSGDDMLLGGQGKDTIEGGTGDDHIMGDGVLQATHKGSWYGYVNASHYGGMNNSKVTDYEINDVTSQAGNDKLYGGAGNDTIEGGAGHDVLSGGSGDDVLLGGTGADWMNGGSGDDLLVAGQRSTSGNKDTMIGGSGADTFFLTAGSDAKSTEAATVVEDFVSGTAGAVAKSVLKKLAEGVATAAAGPIAGFIADKAAGEAFDLASLAWQSFKGIEADGKSGGADMVTVLDFNPTEDIIVLPNGDYHGYTFSYEIVMTSVTELGSRDDEYAIRVTYETPTGDHTFAEIFLDPALMNEMGISAKSDDALDILNGVIQTSVRMSSDGASNIFDENGEFILADDTGSSLNVMGAVGSLVNTNPNIDDGAPMIGTKFDDMLGANEGWVAPGSEGSLNANINAEEGFEIWGFGGDDMIQGSATSDELHGGDGKDVIYTMGANGGQDEVYAGNGDDWVLTGTDFAGAQVRDTMIADGGAGFDAMCFAYASDGVVLYNDGDTVLGRDSNETGIQYQMTDFEAFYGSTQRDVLFFNDSTDDLTLNGYGGDDYIAGGQGDDNLTGGAGEDRFVFSANHGDDTITDFDGSEGDIIDLSALGQVSDFNDMIAHHSTETQNGVEIDTGEGSILLENATLAELNAQEFVF